MSTKDNVWSVSTWALLTLCALALLVLSSFATRLRRSLSYQKLPPGPFCWPVVGYTPFLDLGSGYLALQKLAEKYGKVFSLYVGDQLVVVLGDSSVVQEAYNRDEFQGRPAVAFQLLPDQGSIIEVEGPPWKEQRRFHLGLFRLLGVGTPSFESMVKTYVADVIKKVRCSEGRDVDLTQAVELALNNITFQMMYGKGFNEDHPMIRFLTHFNDTIMLKLKIQGLRTFFPLLGHVVNFVYNLLGTVNKTIKQMDDLIKKEIKEHQENLDLNEPRDYLDHFLIKMSQPNHEDFYNMPNLLGNAKMLLVASSETSRLTLTWFLLLMAAHPREQDKVQAEIDAVLGRDRDPSHSDRVLLPYTSAAIMESMRLKNILHLNLVKKTLSDTTLCGFDIPKGTLIVHNMTSQFHDPLLWDRPHEYDPKRFLTEDGSKVVVHEHFMPFSFGKRNCVGEKVAQIQYFLFAVTIMQKFRVLPPDGGVNLEMKTVFNNTQVHPFARFQWRQ